MQIMKRNTSILLASLLGLCLIQASPMHAQDAVYGMPGDWLASYQTARTSAMGGAYVANADGSLGILWNPAGLSRMLQNQAHFETVDLFGESRMNAFSFALPGRGFPSVGISIVTLNSGDFEKTNELNDNLGTFSEGDMAIYLSASKALSPRFRLGANFKLVRQSIEDFSAGGVGLDLGLMFDLSHSWRIGASALNIGGPNLTMSDVEESYPIDFRGGVAWRGMNGRATITAEIDSRDGPGAVFLTGGEVWVVNMLALRAGYGNERVGGGLSVRVSHNMRVDYGARDNELGVLHRFGLVYDFGGFHASSQAKPEIFSPTGENSVTTFDLKARTRGEPAEWTLDILDKQNNLVRRFGGKGGPPSHVLWDGTNESGMPLPDGVYRYSLLVTDDEGVEVDAKEHKVTISTAGPQGTIPVEVD